MEYHPRSEVAIGVSLILASALCRLTMHFLPSTVMTRFLEHILCTVTLAVAIVPAFDHQLCAAAGDPPVFARKEPETADEAVKVHACVVGEATAGATVRVAVTFDIHPGWHIYWENAGESGAPTDMRFELPAGCSAPMVSAGRPHIDFPTPQIFTHGETTFGYEKRVTLSVPVTLPQVIPSAGLPVKVASRWLVCKGRCLMGNNEIEVDLSKPVSAESASGKELTASLARVPKSAPTTWSIALEEVGADSAVLTIDTHTAHAIKFVPYDTPGVLLETGFMAESNKGEVQGELQGKLRVKLNISRDNSLESALKVAGIVIVGNESSAYSFRLPVPAVTKTAG